MSQVPVLVIAHYDENLDWVNRVRGFEPCIVSKTDPGAHIFQRINRGVEASAYLEYIVKSYDTLAEYTVFVHGHETSWHHEGPMDELLNSLVLRGPYRNINKFYTDDPDHSDDHAGHSLMYIPFPSWRNHLLVSHGMQPYGQHSEIRPCAMFFVHQDLIRRHPRDTYVKLLEAAYACSTKDDGITFEYSWFKIFTGLDDELVWDLEHDQSPYV